MTDDKFLANAVLVYGPRKAGTTLLQSLLDGGEAMIMLPGELKLKWLSRRDPDDIDGFVQCHLKWGRLDFPDLIARAPSADNGSADDDRAQLTARGEYHLAGLTKEQTDALFDSGLYVENLSRLRDEPPADIGAVLKHDVAAFTDAVRAETGHFTKWASKEVGSDPRRVIAFFNRLFPEGKVVYLVREPAFIVRSIIMDRRRKGIRMSWGRVLRECAEAQNIVDNALGYAQGKAVVVAYEHLTADTETEMKRIAAGLGIPFGPVLTKPTTLGMEMVVRTSSRPTREVFRQASKWTKDLAPDHIFCIHLFQAFAPLLYRLKGRRFTHYPQLLRELESLHRPIQS